MYLKEVTSNEKNYTYKLVKREDMIRNKWYRIGGPTYETDANKDFDDKGRIGQYYSANEYSKKNEPAENKTYIINLSAGSRVVYDIPRDLTDEIEELISENLEDPIYEDEPKSVGGRRRSYRKISSRKAKKSNTMRRSRNSRKRRYSRRR